MWQVYKKHRPSNKRCRGDLSGGCLLSHLRSTIGVTGLNFSVRDGKRWIPGAITTLIRLQSSLYSVTFNIIERTLFTSCAFCDFSLFFVVAIQSLT